MVWLVTHIWVGLALAAMFGLLFGWAFRGVTLKGKARDAMVQRDIALTELEQSRLEIDQLYAAQSKGIGAATQAGDETLRLELEAREEKLQALGQELAASRGELDELKSKALAGAGALAAGVAGAAIIGNQSAADTIAPEDRLDADLNLNDASLEWRNRYLASRVRSLEAQVDEAPAEVDTAELEAANLRASEAQTALEAFKAEAEETKEKAIAAALTASAASAVAAGDMLSKDKQETEASQNLALGLEKQGWQNNYLRHRLASVQMVQPVTDADAIVVQDVPDVDVEEETAVIVAAEKQAWQSQYLRQRLAYLEAYPPKERGVQSSGAKKADDAKVAEELLLDDPVDAASDLEDQSNDPGELEQELARLRWRNRYLEGRLAYIDGDAPKSDDEIAAQSTLGAEAHDHLEDLEEEVEVESEPEERVELPDEADVVEPVAVEPVAEIQEPTAADAVLAAMDGGTQATEVPDEDSKPDALQQPADGGDDLTRIDGVDEGTALSLNEIGIWYYHQLAGLRPENTVWLNQYFKAEERVEAEDWIAQAGALSLGADIS